MASMHCAKPGQTKHGLHKSHSVDEHQVAARGHGPVTGTHAPQDHKTRGLLFDSLISVNIKNKKKSYKCRPKCRGASESNNSDSGSDTSGSDGESDSDKPKSKNNC